jgi:hypothetical protein
MVILHGILMIILGASEICILSSIEWFIVWFYLLIQDYEIAWCI